MIAAISGVERDRTVTRPAEAIIQPGRNCWRVERASRFYCIQDAADYFRLVRQALLSARDTVFCLGWDITAHTDLQPDETASDVPSRLDKLLTYVARRRPHLRCYILTWDYGALYTLERDPLTRWRLGWRMPRGVHLEFDDHHPPGACHHQKIVVIDDQLAFCGGIDLTGHRWDTSAHRPEEPARRTPLGTAYGPYHEVQAMVMGPPATSLGELARDRWRAIRDDRMPSLKRSTESPDLWPSDITPDFTDVNVAIARTVPGSESRPAIRECEALFLDSIGWAKHTIYIESQYFTNDKLARALAARLREPQGPEVIVVAPRECQGWLEKTTMGAFRDGAFRHLIAADENKRLRLVYPAASRSGDVPTFVHSKVMIVDDALARIGSANWSHRSMGMDTECDVAVDAGGDPGVRERIRHLRDRLLAEHLGLSVDAVAHGVELGRSIAALIDRQGSADRTLVRIDVPAQATPPSPLVQAAADPDEPIAFRSSMAFLLPSVDSAAIGGARYRAVLQTAGFAAIAAVVWTSSLSLDSIRSFQLSVWTGVAAFVMGGLLLIPLELLTIAAGMCFGAVRGGSVGLIGSLALAGAGYIGGRTLGAERLARWMSRQSYRSARQLGARGVDGVAVLHLTRVASATVIHLIGGAARLPFATYMAGTAIGLAPSIAALSGVGALLRHALENPTTTSGLLSIGAGLLFIALWWGLRALLLIRHFAPSVSRHRERAEFG